MDVVVFHRVATLFEQRFAFQLRIAFDDDAHGFARRVHVDDFEARARHAVERHLSNQPASRSSEA